MLLALASDYPMPFFPLSFLDKIDVIKQADYVPSDQVSTKDPSWNLFVDSGWV